MILYSDIEKLAELSRLQLSATEIAALEKDFTAILEYVGQVSEAKGIHEVDTSDLHNVMRDDLVVPHALGDKRDEVLRAAPSLEGDYLMVRKIIAKDE